MFFVKNTKEGFIYHIHHTYTNIKPNPNGRFSKKLGKSSVIV